jgi:hypothetical protein
MVLRKVFRPKKEAVAGGLRILHNDDLHNLGVSPKIFRMIKSSIMRLADHRARMGVRTIAYKILVGRRKRNRSLGKPKHRWGIKSE